MLKRFDTAVVAAKPDLVLWQLGTNSVIRDHKLADHGAAIRDGLKKIRAIGADVVLIDPQFAPKVIVKPEAAHMVELIATTAKQEDVDLFRRFDVMKRWNEVDHIAFETFVAPDGLHMNDWSYACMAKGLGHGDRRSRAAAGPVGDGDACIWCRNHFVIPARPTGPREARPDDRLRREPGIQKSKSKLVSGFRVRRFAASRNDRHTLSSAVSRSSIRSSACSRPAEKRINPSPMPSSARCSGVSR